MSVILPFIRPRLVAFRRKRTCTTCCNLAWRRHPAGCLECGGAWSKELAVRAESSLQSTMARIGEGA